MSVHATNRASRLILTGSFDIAAHALAGTALPLIGPLGGALFGATRFISQIPLMRFGIKYLNSQHPLATSSAKTLAKALQFFGSYAAAWAALALAGFVLTPSHVVTLTVLSVLYGVMLSVFLQCMGMDPHCV